MKRPIKINLVYLLCFLLLSSSKQYAENSINKPLIVAGKAKLTGKVTASKKTDDIIVVTIILLHPISGENVQYKAIADYQGKFAIDVDVETNISLVGIYTSLNSTKLLFIKLKNNDVTDISISYNAVEDVENVKVSPDINQYDVLEGFKIMDKMIQYRPDRTFQPLHDKSLDYFLKYIETSISEKLSIVKTDSLLSEELKEVFSNDLRLWMYKVYGFNYEQAMMLNFRNTNSDKSKKPNIQKIDRNYYLFLKDLNLSDMRYLNCFTFQDFQKEIFQNDIIGLPEIGESDIAVWLKAVKARIANLVGFSEGLYYDILAANAYGRQLNEELRPLSEKQKQNIEKYWKSGEIAKILFRKNQEVLELDRLKSPVVVNDVSSLKNNKVVESILNKHQNKVILIDLWATWCSPCLEAMQEFRSTKNDLYGKDVVFVYLTNGSSPKKLWEEKIKGIGNEQYYLNDSQWEYIMNKFDFEAIPSYLLYDKKGVLVKKFTSFPGSDEVKGMISNLF